MIPNKVKNRCLEESLNYALSRTNDMRLNAYGVLEFVNGQLALVEVFTPTPKVLEILENLNSSLWEEGKTFIDPTCGNGQFLAAVLIIKIELGHPNPLSTIYGVDIMQDNVDECRQRLIDIAGDTPDNWDSVRNNIRCEDGLTYDYSFKKPEEELFTGKLVKGKKAKKEQPKPVEIVDIFTFD